MPQLHFKTHKDQDNHVLAVAETLELDVKNIKFFRGHDGMTGINADIYYQGKKFAHAYDDARGGEMDIDCMHNNPIAKKVMEIIIQKLRDLPKYKVTFTEDINGRKISGEPIEYTTRVKLCDIVDAIAHKKEIERIERSERKKAIYFINTKGEERYIQWKWPLDLFLKKYPKHALEAINKVIQELKADNCTIRHQEYLQSLGVTV